MKRRDSENHKLHCPRAWDERCRCACRPLDGAVRREDRAFYLIGFRHPDGVYFPVHVTVIPRGVR